MIRSVNLLIRTLVAFNTAFILSAPSFSEPPNLSLLKKEVRNYYDSGSYQKELMTTIEQAHEFIISQALSNQKNNKHQKLALVLDIDETSLSNYSKMVKRDFVGNRQTVHQEILAADSPPIEPMLSLYRDAINHGIKVFFVTGRFESERDATQANLVKAGYKDWAGLYLRPDEYNHQSIIPFKSQARKTIAKKGYTIVASIGDQYSDIKGGNALKGFKLPNPFYYLP